MTNPRRRSFWTLGVAGATIALASAPGTADAQTMGAGGNGWALDRFDPSPAGDLFFAAERPWYTGDRPFAIRFGVIGDYARDPLVVRGGSPDAPVSTAVVENMIVLHGQIGIALFDRVGLHFSVPVSVWQSGNPNSDLNVAPAANPTLVDPRAGLRVRIVGQPDRDPISLHVGAMGYLNSALVGVSRADNATDDQWRARFYLNLSGRGGPVRWSLTGGFHMRLNPITVADTLIGNEVYVNAGLGFAVLDSALTFGPEAFLSTTIERPFQWRQFNAEVLLGVHYLIAHTVLVGIGGGPGLTQGAGTPLARGLVQIAYAPEPRPAPPPPPPDTDRDGLIDAEDLCPTVPMGPHPDPARRGCPIGDRDHDTVLDNVDVCPDEPQGEHPDPARRGCPEGDRDHDTVLDSADQCPDVPRGDHPDPERAGCPDGDDDHDGVLNHDDQCRTENAGPQPDPARPGCPIPDRDHDTVPDATDHCPDQPGAPNPDPNQNGCPGLVRVVEGAIQILSPVFFATNRDTILRQSFPVLTAVANALRASPQIHRVSIEGHTDDQGDDTRNLHLSERRAASVQTWLVNHGIDAGRIEAHGFGETRPTQRIEGLRGRALREARAANRRVEFRIVDPAPVGPQVMTTPDPNAPPPPPNNPAPSSTGPAMGTTPSAPAPHPTPAPTTTTPTTTTPATPRH